MANDLDGYTEVYVLRHATPAKSMPNRTRPLTDLGQRQAEALAPYLSELGITVVYTSPFTRAINTVKPFCNANGIEAIEREDLRESNQDEEFPAVRTRMMNALSAIAESHRGERILVCTHGGCTWSVISYFEENFGLFRNAFEI